MTSFKNPPEMRKGLSLEDWLKEVDIWDAVTDLTAEKKGPALFLSLKGSARKSVLANVSLADMKLADGLSKIKAALKKHFTVNKAQDAFSAFEEFINFRRPSTMDTEDFLVEFDLRLAKIKTHQMALPEGVLGYYVLMCANLSKEQTTLCRATCQDLTFDKMKEQIQRVVQTKASDNKTNNASEDVPLFFTSQQQQCNNCFSIQNQQYDEDAEYDEEEYDDGEVQPSTTDERGNVYYARPRGGQNPNDETGKPSQCSYCSSIFHWARDCPDAPTEQFGRAFRGGNGRGRGRSRRSGNGNSGNRGYSGSRTFSRGGNGGKTHNF